MADDRYDLIVIGSGPGGYVCAIRAAQLGLRVACVEKDKTLGGTCLNVGCIPSKALLESSERYAAVEHALGEHGVEVGKVRLDLAKMMERKRGIVDDLVSGIPMLFKKNRVVDVRGHGRIDGAGTVVVTGEDGERTLSADAIVIATGSEPAPLRGVDFDGERVVTSTEALSFEEVPGHLVVVGAGVIGLELGSVWRRLGSKVTVLEYLEEILPGTDAEIAKLARKVFTDQGIEIVTGAAVQSAKVSRKKVTVGWKEREGGAERTVSCDRVLVAVGRRPFTDGLGCDEAGIERDERGRIRVGEDYQTSLDGVYAIGDVIAGPMLAHKASDEGIAIAELLAGQQGHVTYDAIPSVIYTHPEIASVGRTQEQLEEAGVAFKRGRYKFNHNGRAMALGDRTGLVKILAHAETGRILGAHVLGARAGDLIAEIVLAIEMGATAEDVARTVHAHPTLSEIVREAVLDVDRRSIHQ
ncbi:MAG: dihydrolipoyl dehydrogenase [Deltaproteobacteria bacterium]|nr:dihydrolipoyl dehydrogenase [Deltaproteobacteria bacterium]